MALMVTLESYRTNLTQKQLAAFRNVSQSTISRLARRMSPSWLTRWTRHTPRLRSSTDESPSWMVYSSPLGIVVTRENCIPESIDATAFVYN
ncbi:transposase family protein [Actinopolyspora lacussalsi]